jgi:hypothetical protein
MDIFPPPDSQLLFKIEQRSQLPHNIAILFSLSLQNCQWTRLFEKVDLDKISRNSYFRCHYLPICIVG